MNLLTRDRFPTDFLSTPYVAKRISHWREVHGSHEIESCSRQIQVFYLKANFLSPLKCQSPQFNANN